MTFVIRQLHSNNDVMQAFPLMHALRERLDQETFLSEIRRQENEGYKLFGGFTEDKLVVLAGIRQTHTLARGEHLFVDDLVSSEDSRGKGYGTEMMRWLASKASDEGIERIYLDSRATAREFYARLGFTFLTSIPAWIDVKDLREGGKSMTMNRILEPELMTDLEQAKAYASADFSEPHSRFIQKFQETFSGVALTGHVLDLGCGPGDITFRFAKTYSKVTMIGIDGSKAMLDLAQQALLKNPDLHDRIEFVEGCIPGISVPAVHYEAIISNSILHQLHHPEVLWQYIQKYGSSGTRIFIMDLKRPGSEVIAKELTRKYASNEPEILQRDFYNSLLAAFRPEEVLEQLKFSGLAGLKVDIISDRHLLISGEMAKI